MNPIIFPRISAASLLPTLLLLSSTRFVCVTSHDNVNSDHNNEPNGSTRRRTLTNQEKHELRRDAMDAVFHQSTSPDNDGDALFPSAQEQRSYYYFHAGVEMAWRNAMIMSFGSTQDRDIDDDADEELSMENMDDAYLQRLEEAIEEELARVRSQLIEIDGGEDDGVLESDAQDQINGKSNGADADKSGAQYVDASDGTPELRLQNTFKQQYMHFQCSKYPRSTISLSDAKGKWNELREQLWGLPIDTGVTGMYISNPDLYVDFITNGGNNTSNNNTNTTRRGLFAARNFEPGEVVYSQRYNRIYFPSPSMWVTFLHSLRSSQDACLALEWSFMKQISRPGRWVLGLVLDEGVFLRQSKEGNDNKDEVAGKDDDGRLLKGNVAVEDDRSLEYEALRSIKRGEEIVEHALPDK